jgi:hypothetical protein
MLKVGDHCAPQPVNRLMPIALTASRRIICKRRRFLNPRKQQRATANVVPGTSGLDLELAISEAAVVVIVIVPEMGVTPSGVTLT